jgi:hypothetical protein
MPGSASAPRYQELTPRFLAGHRLPKVCRASRGRLAPASCRKEYRDSSEGRGFRRDHPPGPQRRVLSVLPLSAEAICVAQQGRDGRGIRVPACAGGEICGVFCYDLRFAITALRDENLYLLNAQLPIGRRVAVGERLLDLARGEIEPALEAIERRIRQHPERGRRIRQSTFSSEQACSLQTGSDHRPDR